MVTNLKKHRVGEKFTHPIYGEYKIIDYQGAKKVTVEFESGYMNTTSYYKIKNGKGFRDRFKTIKAFIGDVNTLNMSKSDINKAYNLWYNVLTRSSNVENSKVHPCYQDVVCGVDFLTFVNFANWCDKQAGFRRNGYELDKDILKKGNRTYTAEFCCFVPKYINSLTLSTKSNRGELPIGVSEQDGGYTVKVSRPKIGEKRYVGFYKDYKEAFLKYKEVKESYIKVVAELYKEEIDEKVYNALYNFSIEMDD